MAWVCIPQLILGVLQIASGECILNAVEHPPNLSNPYVVAADVFVAVLWMLFLWWLWTRASAVYLGFLSGNAFLARRPRVLRWGYTAVIMLAATSMAVEYTRALAG